MDPQVNRQSRYKILRLNLALYYLAKIQEIDRDINFINDNVKKINIPINFINFINDNVKKINFEIAEDIKRKLNVSYKVEKNYKI